MTLNEEKRSLSECLKSLRGKDSKKFDGSLSYLLRNSESVKHDIFDVAQEEDDARVKGALIEVLGASRDQRFIPFLAEQLQSESQEVRFWSFAALQQIGGPEALKVCSKEGADMPVRLSANENE